MHNGASRCTWEFKWKDAITKSVNNIINAITINKHVNNIINMSAATTFFCKIINSGTCNNDMWHGMWLPWVEAHHQGANSKITCIPIKIIHYNIKIIDALAEMRLSSTTTTVLKHAHMIIDHALFWWIKRAKVTIILWNQEWKCYLFIHYQKFYNNI